MKVAGNRRWLGIIGVLLSSVFCSLVANLLSNGFRRPGSAILVCVIIGIATGLVYVARELPPLFHRSTVVVKGWSTSRRAALVCTISDRPGASDELVPIILEQLQKRGPITCLGLVGTAETQAVATVRTIIERLGSVQGLQVKEVPCDPLNLKDAQLTTQSLIDWATISCSIPSRQVLVDVTGGTVIMTLGAYQAAQEAGVDVEYVATPRKAGQRADMEGRYPIIVSRGRSGIGQLQRRGAGGRK